MFKKDIFKNKNFMILWIGQLVSKIGDYVLEFALAWYLYDLTGSTIALSLAIPIFTIIFGFLGEYINFQNIIVISSIIFFVSLIPAPLIFFNGKKSLSQDFNL